MAILNPKKYALGERVQIFPKSQYEKIVELCDKVNEISSNKNEITTSTISSAVAGELISVDSGFITNGSNIENLTGTTTASASFTLTASEVLSGLLKPSAPTTAATLPSAASLIALIDGSGRGTTLDFIVDNQESAGTCTVTASASITAATAVITGGATLTVASGAVGLFRIYFTSTTTAKIYRIG